MGFPTSGVIITILLPSVYPVLIGSISAADLVSGNDHTRQSLRGNPDPGNITEAFRIMVSQ